MLEDILVSIITPTYNRSSDVLDRTIKSLINQSHKKIEVIIVDDNPPESEYRREISKYISSLSDNRIKYIKNKKNIGGALSRNEGISIATGEYITFLDDDDIYLKDKVKNQLSLMIETGAELSFTNLKICNKKNEVIDFREFSFIENFDNNSLMRYHLTRNLTGTPTFMFKTNSLKKIGGFDNVNMGHEFFLMYKAIDKGLNISYFPINDVIAFRTNADSISNGEGKISGENAIYKFKKDKFNILNKEEKKMVEFRHKAVLSVAYKRRKEYFKMFISLIEMFFTSPKYSLKEGFRFTKNYITK